MTGHEEPRPPAKRDAFASIAMWQFMGFIMLICFVWVSELLDLPALIFRIEHSPFSFYRACVLTAAVLTTGVVAVGHTYEKQRSLITKLLRTCLYCHRVKTHTGTWMYVEEYFIQNFPVAVDHHACPDCQQMLDSVEQKSGEKKDIPA